MKPQRGELDVLPIIVLGLLALFILTAGLWAERGGFQ